jgi:pimeloyl-ACP methyl ester carboxylesterase
MDARDEGGRASDEVTPQRQEVQLSSENTSKPGLAMQPDRRTLLGSAGAAILAGVAASALHQDEVQAQTPSADLLPPGASSRFVSANGIKLHYVTMGQGPTLLLLHGWPQTWFAWHKVMARFADNFTVVAPDLRGTGLSEVTAAGYDKKTIAEDLRSLIEQIGDGKANVVGHDMGGKASYVLAHLYPQVVERLVLVDCLVPTTENMDALRGGAWHYGFHMAADFPELLTRGREREYIRAQIKQWSWQKDAIDEASISEFARRYAEPGRMTAGFNYYRSLRDDVPIVAPLRGRKFAMPVMTITGDRSAGTRLAEALKDEAPSLRSVIAKDCGHFVAEEAPDFFVEQVQRFLAD